MGVCTKCYQEVSVFRKDIFSGLCPDCKRGVTPVKLGCGTLILIAIIFAAISGGINDEHESKVFDLTTAVEELKETVGEQTTEIKRLQEKIDNAQADQPDN